MQGARRHASRSPSITKEAIEQRPVAPVVDLPGQVLEEAVQLIQVPVGGGQEPSRIDPGRLGYPLDLEQFDDQILAEALDPPANPNHIPAFKLPAQSIRVLEGPRRHRPRAVA